MRRSRRSFIQASAAAALTLALPLRAQEAQPPALSFEAGSERLDFTPEDIWTVTVHPGRRAGAINLEIHLTGDARDAFARFTAIHVGQPTAVFLGGEYVMEAIIQVPVTGGRMAIAFDDQPSAAAAMDRLLGR